MFETAKVVPVPARARRTKGTCRSREGGWKHTRIGMETHWERQCLSREGGGSTQGEGSVLATKGNGSTRQRRCRYHKAVETQGKGSVLAAKAVETQGKGGVLTASDQPENADQRMELRDPPGRNACSVERRNASSSLSSVRGGRWFVGRAL